MTNQKDNILSEEINRIQELENHIEKIEQEKEDLTEQLKAAEEKLLRASADVQNIRRRSDQDRIQARQDGAKEIIFEMVKIADYISLATAHLPEELKDNQWATGVIGVQKHLDDTLAKLGVEFIEYTENEEFNADKHESLMLDPNTPSNIIAQVMERGVIFRGVVIRPAKVSVGSA